MDPFGVQPLCMQPNVVYTLIILRKMKFIPSTSTNKGLLQNLYKLAHLGRYMGTLPSFSATCKMGIRFYNFLFAFMSDKALPK